MARPSSITADTAALIAASKAPNPARLLAELQAAGVQISGRTLRRHLAKTERSPASGMVDALRQKRSESTAALEQQAASALEGGDVASLTSARNAIEKAMVDWRHSLGFDARAVRAYATLARALGDVAKRLAELQPPPAPEPDHDPANVAAKARLLAVVDQILARSDGAP